MVSIVGSQNESWMSQVTEGDRLVVPTNYESVGALLAEPGVSVVYRSQTMIVLTCLHPSGQALWRHSSSGWMRLFEQTYFAPSSDEGERIRLISGFFDWLSIQYCDEIEPAHNRACYEYLFQLAQEYRGGAACEALLDVGCGPGTILTTHLPMLVPKIVGYDIGGEVRRAARAMGLPVMTADEFLLGIHSIDVAVSAFVMHYGCDVSVTLRAVAQHLSYNGVWALNFHKGINLPLFLQKLPDSGLRLATAPKLSPFGSAVTVIANGAN